MSRLITVGACQMGPIQRSDGRSRVVKRLIDLLRQAAEHRCDLAVFPELTLTTFFPRWWMTQVEEIDSFFERDMPSTETAPLFEAAQRLGIGFYLGFAEIERRRERLARFNTSILVDKSGHWPQYERAEEFNRTLLEFLDDRQHEVLIDSYRKRYW